MKWQTKDNLENALLELTGRKELPRKLVLHLTKHPTVKLAWSNNRPITEDVLNCVAEQLAGNVYCRFPHKTSEDIARHLKMRMQWKGIEKNLNKPQTPRIEKPSRALNAKSRSSPIWRRPIIPLAI
ncbi:MAG TPA: hypothetical protein DEP11_03530 [Candidatus Jacksonbacteria bacterium]|nr:hypothetical protein [Candidatus Jacksonbacteria bacterium]